MLKIQGKNTLNINNFDETLVQTLDETLDFIFGEHSSMAFYRNLKENNCTKYDISKDPRYFQSAVYASFPSFFNMSIPLFLRVILERFCKKMNYKFSADKAAHFSEYIYELRETYIGGENR